MKAPTCSKNRISLLLPEHLRAEDRQSDGAGFRFRRLGKGQPSGKRIVDFSLHAMNMLDADSYFVVDCVHHEKGATVRKECPVGFSGCMISQRRFPASRISIDHFCFPNDQQESHTLADTTTVIMRQKG